MTKQQEREYRTPMDVWLDKPWLDWLMAAAVSALAVYTHVWQYVTVLDRASLYQTMAGISLGFLSLSTVAITLVVTVTPSQQLREILVESGRDLLEAIFACLWALIVSTISYTALYAMNRPDLGASRTAVFVAASALMLLSLSRVLRLLQLTLRVLL